MKLFVSYRRNDTGGRAGRLVDALVAQFGARNVFQDVDALELGHSFRAQVEDAIATSDALLIVIGQDWLGVDDAAGGRRIDSEDDFVRLEVSMALSLGISVVPVLVDGAVLPTHTELPDDMSQMLGRQAVTIRDTSWHQDVGDVIRRLKGEDRPTTPARRWPMLAAVVLLILVGVFVVAAVVRSRGEDSSASESPPDCDPPDDTWVPVELSADPSIQILNNDGNPLTFLVQEARIGGTDNTQVVIELAVRNDTDDRPDDNTDDHYFYDPDIDGLLVNGVSYELFCFGPVTGQQTLEPGERAIAWIGFRTTGVATGSELMLALNPDGRFIIGTSR